MKNPIPANLSVIPVFPRGFRRHRHGSPGFALIVTLSLMILLTVIAVGLLTLSSISLRSVSQGNAMSTARANARLALMLALGDLQKYVGPDQRVTARADVLGEEIANPRLTGVWQSWDIKASSPPSPSDYSKSSRDQKFLGWLTSSLDSKETTTPDFVRTAPGGDSKSVARLWGKGTLGPDARDKDLVSAVKVPISGGKGAYAYAVMDEGVKVRINTPFESQAATVGTKTAQLGAGQRPNTSAIPGLDKLKRDNFLAESESFRALGKGITPLNFALAAQSVAGDVTDPLKSLSHEVTTVSRGLFTDTAVGGLKEDFSLLTNTDTLPDPYVGKGVYQSRLGISPPSDPRWESLRQFAGLYRDSTRLADGGGVPYLRAQGPRGWTSSRGANPTNGTSGTVNPEPPEGVVLMPSVVKVQMVFSLATRDIYNYPMGKDDSVPKTPGTEQEEKTAEMHGPWGSNFAGSQYDYLLHLLYTPVVTLHNPYNVALEFRELQVMFGNVPFALKVFRNGVAQTSKPAPLDTMYYQSAETGVVSKRFGMTLTNATRTGAPGTAIFKMLPGEVLMFSPYIDPNLTWKSQYGTRTFSDWDDDATRTIVLKGTPGWRGDGIGFDLDWFCPSYAGPVSTNEVEGSRSMGRGGCIGARKDDNFYLEFSPLSVPTLSRNKYSIEIFAKPVGARAPVSSGTILLDYQSPTGLQNTMVSAGGKLRYPKTGTVNTMAMHSHSLRPIKNIVSMKPFAVVSAQARTTLGGQDPAGEDGAVASKPWCFAHASGGASSTRLVGDGPASGSHEFGFQMLENGTDNLMQYDPFTGRGNFVTGQGGTNGLKFGVMDDIPLAPIQGFASLNGANPGGSSGYLPRFAQPIGNSWAHPMLNSTELITAGDSYALADHSFLLNLALYDHFYFSGLADQNGVMNANGKSTNDLVQDFVAGKPLPDPRISLHVPAGETMGNLTSEVADSRGFSKIAAWQMMNGAFNINSTSVAAWKAMLGSIHDANAIYNGISGTSTSLESLPPTDSEKNQARISRFRLPVSQSEADGGEPREAYWLGPREYSDGDLELLATKIVEQVRLRGPFLSMSDFVNRQLGNDEKAQSGALQQAIDESGLNAGLASGAFAGYEIPEGAVGTYKYKNPKAGAGSSYQGAPGFLCQADLLSVFGNAATARSDTFTIRGYGETRDAGDHVVASAVCEAVIQRYPEYIDVSDNANVLPASLTSESNRVFGRRFGIVSFRWLSASEI